MKILISETNKNFSYKISSPTFKMQKKLTKDFSKSQLAKCKICGQILTYLYSFVRDKLKKAELIGDNDLNLCCVCGSILQNNLECFKYVEYNFNKVFLKIGWHGGSFIALQKTYIKRTLKNIPKELSNKYLRNLNKLLEHHDLDVIKL